MIISFIGMSGSGKSYWSKKIQEKGFKRYCCDDLIEEKLGDELTLIGYKGIQDVAKWMGLPFEPQYKRSSKKYIQVEEEVLKEILDHIECFTDENIVIDTTGSVIYTRKELLTKLAKQSRIIYYDTPDAVKKEMYQLYLEDPKPVIWGNKFTSAKNESQMEALAKCYPQLLAYRSKKYEKIAHKKLDYHMVRGAQFTVDLLLKEIYESLS